MHKTCRAHELISGQLLHKHDLGSTYLASLAVKSGVPWCRSSSCLTKVWLTLPVAHKSCSLQAMACGMAALRAGESDSAKHDVYVAGVLLQFINLCAVDSSMKAASLVADSQ